MRRRSCPKDFGTVAFSDKWNEESLDEFVSGVKFWYGPDSVRCGEYTRDVHGRRVAGQRRLREICPTGSRQLHLDSSF